MVGYQVIAEESLEEEPPNKSPTSTHDTEGGQVHVIGGDLGGRVHVVGGDDLDPSEGHLETEDGDHHGVIIPGMMIDLLLCKQYVQRIC